MNSVVLWYDIGRQGATNESMAENPTLKDLSGNGNDATCYNFGWSGMSGIGGYSMPNLTTWIKNSNVVTETITDNKIKIVSGGNAESGIGIRKSYTSDISIKFSFTELVSSIMVYKKDNIGSTLIQSITEEGEYIFDFEYDADKTYCYILIAGLGTVEQLPLYPNALVSDGVDDYAFVQDKYDDEGNLINKKSLVLNKDDGYTVIAKRKHLKDVDNQRGSVCSKAELFSSLNGAFILEGNFNRNNTRAFNARNFGLNNYLSSITTNDITYQTSTKTNDTTISKGNSVDTDKMVIGKLDYNTQNFFAEIALYSLILFNRDLTDEEIEWVKNNLIQ